MNDRSKGPAPDSVNQYRQCGGSGKSVTVHLLLPGCRGFSPVRTASPVDRVVGYQGPTTGSGTEMLTAGIPFKSVDARGLEVKRCVLRKDQGLVDKYRAIFGWDIRELDEALSERQIVQALRQALDGVVQRCTP